MYEFRTGKAPLYTRIKRDLLSKIERGTWSIGHKLPSEDELREQYKDRISQKKVSRGTIRQALSELEAEGFITRMAAKGTFVTRVTPRLEKVMGEITSFTEQLSQSGFEPTTTVLFAKVIKASEAKGRVEEAFGIPADAEVIHVKRLRAASGVPFAIQSVYLLPELCPGILAEELTHLFNLYKEKYDRTIVKADEVLQIGRAALNEAELLKTDLGTSVVIRDRISYDQTGEVFEVLHSIDRGDRFEYRYRIVNDLTEIAYDMAPVLPVQSFENLKS